MVEVRYLSVRRLNDRYQSRRKGNIAEICNFDLEISCWCKAEYVLYCHICGELSIVLNLWFFAVNV